MKKCRIPHKGTKCPLGIWRCFECEEWIEDTTNINVNINVNDINKVIKDPMSFPK